MDGEKIMEGEAGGRGKRGKIRIFAGLGMEDISLSFTTP